MQQKEQAVPTSTGLIEVQIGQRDSQPTRQLASRPVLLSAPVMDRDRLMVGRRTPGSQGD